MKLGIESPPGLKSRRPLCKSEPWHSDRGKGMGLLSRLWRPWLPFHKHMSPSGWHSTDFFTYILPLIFPTTYPSRCDHFRKLRFRKLTWLSQGHAGHPSTFLTHFLTYKLSRSSLSSTPLGVIFLIHEAGLTPFPHTALLTNTLSDSHCLQGQDQAP